MSQAPLRDPLPPRRPTLIQRLANILAAATRWQFGAAAPPVEKAEHDIAALLAVVPPTDQNSQASFIPGAIVAHWAGASIHDTLTDTKGQVWRYVGIANDIGAYISAETAHDPARPHAIRMVVGPGIIYELVHNERNRAAL